MVIKQWKDHHKKMMIRIKKDQNILHIIALSIGIIAIAGISSHFIPQSRHAKENIREYEFLRKIIYIDDIGHKQDELLHKIGSGYNMQRDRLFHVKDNKYHTLQYRDEKYKAAKELNALIKEQNIFIQQYLHSPDQENIVSEEIVEQWQKEINLLLET